MNRPQRNFYPNLHRASHETYNQMKTLSSMDELRQFADAAKLNLQMISKAATSTTHWTVLHAVDTD